MPSIKPTIIIWALASLALLALASPTMLDIVEITEVRELYSYVPLVPLVALYAAWWGRGAAPGPSASGGSGSSTRIGATAAVVLGVSLWAWGTFSAESFRESRVIDVHLMMATLGLVGALTGIAGLTLGRATLERNWFSFTYLLFAVPLPDPWVSSIVDWLMWRSADCVEGLMRMTSQLYYREGTTFITPALPFTVAPECSGIDSTYALLMTAGLAAFLFVSHPGLRVILLLAVVPIAIARNGLRIFTISIFCNYIDPAAIDGSIHKEGGKPFFALSLIPLFLLVWLFKKLESRKRKSAHLETTVS